MLPLPPDAKVGHKAARCFHHAASHYLVAHGLGRGQHQEVAILAGYPEGKTTSYNDALRGRSVSIDRVLGWMESWETKGHPAMRLVASTRSIWVEFETSGDRYGPAGPLWVQ